MSCCVVVKGGEGGAAGEFCFPLLILLTPDRPILRFRAGPGVSVLLLSKILWNVDMIFPYSGGLVPAISLPALSSDLSPRPVDFPP